jgi:hypothetical protein
MGHITLYGEGLPFVGHYLHNNRSVTMQPLTQTMKNKLGSLSPRAKYTNEDIANFCG